MQKMIGDFTEEIKKAEKGEISSLKYLHSFMTPPTGEETGDYLALDFGGTKVKIVLFRLLGQGQYQKLKEDIFFLETPEKDYRKGSGYEMFDYIAEKIKNFLPDDKEYILGHTFSFPFVSESMREGRLLYWSKGFTSTDVNGKRVNEILNKALAKQGVHNVRAEALLNDTVAVILAGRYVFQNCVIGAIIGTGFNCCCFNENEAINLECGNFDKIKRDCYDCYLDAETENQGCQLVEKQISGYYLGEYVRIAGKEKNIAELSGKPFSFTAAELSHVLEEGRDDELAVICQEALERSIKTAAGCFYGILDYLKIEKDALILVDGSVFNKAYGYKEKLNELLGERAKAEALEDCATLGAAIAAAMAVRIK